MDIIELHILQSFPVTCLNRDDVGAPKTAYFGGCQRARVSSQCWKRSIREMATVQQPDLFGAKRTKKVVQELEAAFKAKSVEDERGQKLARVVANALGKLEDIDKGTVSTLLFFSPQELVGVVDTMLASDLDEEELDKALNPGEKKKQTAKNNSAVKIAEGAANQLGGKVKDIADIAVFGRMVADDHTLTMEGAGLFSHALSTHAVSNELDYFSAVDDFNKAGESGAAHIGNTEFNSASYYRYVGLNVDMLKDKDHLQHFEDAELKSVLQAFLKASIQAVPNARKNSQFGQNPPFYVLGLRRNGHPISLVNAFESPVASSNGYRQASKDALENHWEELRKLYCLDDDLSVQVELPPDNLDKVVSQLMKGA